MDVPIQEVGLDFVLLGVGQWMQNSGLLNMPDDQIIRLTTHTAQTIRKVLVKLTGETVEQMGRTTPERIKKFMKMVSDDTDLTAEQKTKLSQNIETDTLNALTHLLKTLTLNDELYENTQKMKDAGIPKSAIYEKRKE